MDDRLYILRGKTPVKCPNLLRWGRWMETGNRIVGQWRVGLLEVSTVFLGVDHSFLGKGPPRLFETMIFDSGSALDYQTRCSTWAQAEVMHEQGIAYAEELVTAATEPAPASQSGFPETKS